MSSLTAVPHKASRVFVLFLLGVALNMVIGAVYWVRPFEEGQGAYVLVCLLLGSACWCLWTGTLWLFCPDNT